MITPQTILEALKSVKDPDLNRDIVSLGFVKDLQVEGDRVGFRLVLTTPACPAKAQLEQAVREAALSVAGVKQVDVKMESEVPKGRGIGERQGVPGIRNMIAVSSGKGGVGKTTVAVNLAVALGRSGARVGLLDTDVYGPNVPIMMGVSGEPRVRNQMLVPHEAHSVKVMSIGFLNPGDRPVVWRGPMLHKAVQQFIYGVDWGELDYLIVDMPPGTGDVQLSLAQLVPVQGAILVTTPQEVALADVRKAFNMFEQVQIPVLGIIENMSYFVCSNCLHRHYIFGSGGGERLAAHFGTRLLGIIPLAPSVREAGDAGVPVVIGAPDGDQAAAFGEIAESVAAQVSVAAMKGAGLPVIDIG